MQEENKAKKEFLKSFSEKLKKFLSEKSEHLDAKWRQISEILGGDVGLCSLAKREEEVFLPGQKNPILFEK